MENLTLRLLDAVKRQRGLSSDYQLGKALGVSSSRLGNYRSGRISTMDDDLAVRVADLLGRPRGAILAALAAERAKSDDVRKAWREAVKRLGGVAAGVLLLLGGGPTPPSAGATASNGGAAVYYVKRRRKPSRRRGAAPWLDALARSLASRLRDLLPLQHAF